MHSDGTCRVSGCSRAARTGTPIRHPQLAGLCPRCYSREYRGLRRGPEWEPRPARGVCIVAGCSRPVHVVTSAKYPQASGTCELHYLAVAQPPKEPPPPRECLWCGSEFQPSRDNHRCCSSSCATSWTVHGRSRLAPTTRRCPHCGEEFTAGPRRLFCSPACQDRSGRRCDTCGDFYRERGRGKTCPRCREQERAHRDDLLELRRIARLVRPVRVAGRPRPAPRLFTAGNCSECGESFVVAGKHMGPQKSGWRVFCSGECGERASRRDHRQRRRARREGKRIWFAKIVERDGWVCGICGDSIDPSLPRTDDMAWSIDHIVPLAAGGEHAFYNVQLAHRTCNSHKRDLLEGQVALPV